MNKTKNIFLLLIITFIFQNLYSQNTEKEEIEILFDKLYFASSDSVKIQVNNSILLMLENYINVKHDYTEDFKEIKNLKSIKSDDKDIFMFTWSMKLDDGSFKYFGFIRYYNNNRGEYYVVKLSDNQSLTGSFSKEQVQTNQWYGAVYYKIISKKYKKKRHYLLLGWDVHDDFTNKKIIDILYIDEDDEVPVFGKNIINYRGSEISRIVFEYKERLAMTLTYDHKKDRIIWDHLSPSHPKFAGLFKYYGPDLSFDALQYEKGIWKYVEDVALD